MARSARRSTVRGQAANLRAAEKSIAKEIQKDIEKKLVRSVQEFAIKSMNGLAEAGPAWTGEFSQSWVFVSEGESAQNPTAGGKIGIGKYNKNDVPVRQVENYLKQGKDRFQIVNTSDHAAIAIDEQEAKFYPVAGGPIKEPVQEGWGRPEDEHFRYQIGTKERMVKDPKYPGQVEEPNSQITAEKDWFPTYVNGGQLQKDLSDGVRLGFSDNVK